MRKTTLLAAALAALFVAACGSTSADVNRAGTLDATGTWTGTVSIITTAGGTESLALTYAIVQSGTVISGSWGVADDATLNGNITGTIADTEITGTLTTNSTSTDCANWNVTMTGTVVSNVVLSTSANGSVIYTTVSGRICADTAADPAVDPNTISISNAMLEQS